MNDVANTAATTTTTLSFGNDGSGLKRQLAERRRQTITALRETRRPGSSRPGISGNINGGAIVEFGSDNGIRCQDLRVHKNIRAPFDEVICNGSDTEQTACERTRDALFVQSKRYMSEEMLNAIIDRVPVEYRKRLLTRATLPKPNAKRKRVILPSSPSDNILPGAIATIVRRLRLLDEPDYLKRYFSVVAYCKLANFSFSTTVVYLRKLCAAELFGTNDNDDADDDDSGSGGDDTDLAIASIINNDASILNVDGNIQRNIAATEVTAKGQKDEPLRGKAILSRYRLDRAQFRNHAHTRLVDDRLYAIYNNHLLHNFNEYTAPLLIVFYTGLRNVEVRQLTNRSLGQLQRRENVVTDVMRKRSSRSTRKYRTDGSRGRRLWRRFRTWNGKERRGTADTDNPNSKDVIEPDKPWMPIYTVQFASFIDHLCVLYVRKLSVLESSVIVNLFDIQSPATLSNRMKCEFFKATGQCLPRGFGLHGNRTTIATRAYEHSPDIHFINRFLAHQSIKTTEIYIKPNIRAMEQKFERVSRARYMPLLRNLDSALETVAVANNATDIVDLANMIRNRDEASVNAFEQALSDRTRFRGC